jgi:alkylation response protein AidB-like acyl-CoA dehydrogenase
MFPGPFMSTVVLCGTIIRDAGSEEQKTQWLPRISDGT